MEPYNREGIAKAAREFVPVTENLDYPINRTSNRASRTHNYGNFVLQTVDGCVERIHNTVVISYSVIVLGIDVLR